MPTTTTGLATSFITFSRPGASGGGATVTDRDGRIKWAGHNLLTNSESFDASAWSKTNTTVSANQSIAPNSTTTGDKLLETAATGFHTLNASATVISGAPYTVSVFCKAAERSLVQVAYLNSNFTAGASADVNLNDGTYTSAAVGSGTLISASVVNIGSGWYLISVTGSQSADTIGRLNVSIGTGTGTYSYAGDVTKGILLWGAHLYRSDLGGMQQNPAMPAGMQSYYPTTPRNLLGYSEAYSDAAWSKSDVLAFGSGSIANAIAAPNGLQTADLITENSATATHSVYQSLNLPTGGSSYTASAYFKAGSRTSALIRIGGPGYTTNANPLVRFTLTGSGTATTLSTGSAVTGSSITPLADGWYRCSVTFTTGTNTLHAVSIGPSDGGSSATYAGNGTGSIYLWGAQLSDSASLDTYVPVYGAAVTSAAYYAPRLDFDPVTLAAKGLLVEEARTNLRVYSSDFDQWTADGVTVSANSTATLAPDGSQTSDLVTASSGNLRIYRSVASLTNGAVYTESLYLKKSVGTSVNLDWINVGNSATNLNFDTGVLTVSSPWTSGSAVSIGNGWFRVTLTGTIGTTSASIAVRFANVSDACYLWGAQLEAGSFATSYIPTGSATATRAADVASVSTQAFPYSTSEGTLVASGTAFNATSVMNGFASPNIVSLSSGSTGEAIFLQRLNNSNGANYLVRASSADQASFSPGTWANGATAKIAGAWALNNFNGAFNGTVGTADTSGSLPTSASELRVGNFSSGNGMWNGWVRQITYLPRRISDSELAARTA